MPVPPRLLPRAACGALAVVAAAGLVAQKNSLAFPKFKETEGVSCTYCHVKPGGPRNYRGKWYDKNKYTFAGFDDVAAAYAAGVDPLPSKGTAPKSLTTPAPVTDAYAKVTLASEALTAKPGDAALTKSLGEAQAALAKAILAASAIPAEARFAAAIKAAEAALTADPKNAAAAADKKAAEAALKAEKEKAEKAAKEAAAAAPASTPAAP